MSILKLRVTIHVSKADTRFRLYFVNLPDILSSPVDLAKDMHENISWTSSIVTGRKRKELSVRGAKLASRALSGIRSASQTNVCKEIINFSTITCRSNSPSISWIFNFASHLRNRVLRIYHRFLVLLQALWIEPEWKSFFRFFLY